MNEFLAGEDISEENIVKIAEDNLIQVAKDSKAKQKNLKLIIAVMLLIKMCIRDRKNNVQVVRCHTSSGSALENILKEYVA